MLYLEVLIEAKTVSVTFNGAEVSTINSTSQVHKTSIDIDIAGDSIITLYDTNSQIINTVNDMPLPIFCDAVLICDTCKIIFRL